MQKDTMIMDLIWRAIGINFLSFEIGAGVFVAIGLVLAIQGNTYMWAFVAGLGYVVTFILVLSVSLIFRLDKAPRPKAEQPALPEPRKIVNLGGPEQVLLWQSLSPVKPPSLFGEWAVIGNEDTLRKMFVVLDKTGTVSTRSMKGVINSPRQLNHLKTFLHVRGWSTTMRKAEVLTDKGRVEIAHYLPTKK